MTVHVLGVRHHGPGSARAVAAALDELQPDAVIIEGAPELTTVIALAGEAAMRPPVAGLVYSPDEPRTANFYPLAAFSPEWVALRWAGEHEVAVQFTDLPAAHSLALERAETLARTRAPDPAEGSPPEPELAEESPAPIPESPPVLPRPADAVREVPPEAAEDPAPTDEPDASPRRRRVRTDPIAVLAAAAGSSDPERWWEDTIEHRYHGLAVFDAVLDAMRAVRERAEADPPPPANRDLWDRYNGHREAAMRRTIRAAMKQHETLAVVCGAWHAPALTPDSFPSAAADAALLRGLPKVKVAATWVPWMSQRLAQASGYGAGVASPGWYHHLFTTRDDPIAAWLVDAASLLRGERIYVSPASVIDAVRLADTLASLRGRPLAGLDETTDAAQAVLCGGSPAPLTLIESRLLVGSELGAVPPGTPMVPLAKDLERLQRKLRLKPSAAQTTVTLDLRNPNHLAKSHLLHRLAILGIDWGFQTDASTTGTFKEAWVLEWQPEFSVVLIDASGAGTTVESAAASVAQGHADEARTLRALTDLVDRTLLAELPEATRHLVQVLADRSAAAHDVTLLMDAVEPLARISRYGNVRRADADSVHAVLTGMTARIFVGLPPACANLDEVAAAEMLERIDAVQRAVALVAEEHDRWLDALTAVAHRHAVPGLLAGRANRLLLDAGRIDVAEARARLSRTLSLAADPVQAAGWVEGFVAGDAMLLIHDPELLAVIDRWVAEAATGVFDDLLPLLRRTFASFTAAERRHIGERLRQLAAGPGSPKRDDAIDPERARRVLPLVLTMLGAPVTTPPEAADAG